MSLQEHEICLYGICFALFVAKTIGYTVGNLVLRRRACGAVKLDFRTHIRRYTSPNENFEYGYPHSKAILQFLSQIEAF